MGSGPERSRREELAPLSQAGGASGPRATGRNTRTALVVLLLVVPAGALAVWAGVPLCPARQLVGIPCPGCGLTRATVALLMLDPTTAWRMHPLAPVLVPLVGWLVVRTGLGAVGWCRGAGALGRVPRPVWALLVATVVAVWAARLAGALGGHPDPIDPANSLLRDMLSVLKLP